MAKKKGGKKGKGKGKKAPVIRPPHVSNLTTPSSFSLWKNRPPVYRTPPPLASPLQPHRAAPQLVQQQPQLVAPHHRPAPQLLTLPTSLLDAIKMADDQEEACDIALSFLTRGGPIDAAGSGRGVTLLMVAAETGNLPLAELLLRRRALVGVQDSLHGFDALMIGAMNGHVSILARLLRAGASIHSTDRITKLTARQLAEKAGHGLAAEVLKARELVTHGKTITRLPTALAKAAIAGEVEAVLAWVECSGGCADAVWDGGSGRGGTAPTRRPPGAAAAAKAGEEEEIEDERSMDTGAGGGAAAGGAPTNKSAATSADPSKEGQTMLMLAAEHGKEGLVGALLSVGANSRLFRGDSQSALQIAAYNGHRGVVRTLVESRSKPAPRSMPWSSQVSSMHLASPALAQRLAELSKPLPVAEYAMEFRMSGRWREAPTLAADARGGA